MDAQGLKNLDSFSSMPAFDEFYKAINQRDPFPWQSRLAMQVASTGKWYSEVGIPTGLGKTACLDIAVWWLASQAYSKSTERIAPTRIWWVVNRRLLVDSTHKHAEKINEVLNDPESLQGRDKEVAENIATRLRSIAGSGKNSGVPLEVIRMRGGIASTRPSCPSQPAILLTTLPMYGSRLLFRGYGTSRNMSSIDAAMAGTDSLVLLDEAHLTPHLKTLCTAISECTSHVNPILNSSRSKPILVELTATGRQNNGAQFTLNKEDESHPIIKKRLDAAKLLELRVETKKNDNCFADAAYDLIKDTSAPTTCIVFVNSPKTARKTFSRLKKRMKEAKVLLLTGRMREREAEDVRNRILNHSSTLNHHHIYVATQTLEVGADIDSELLVTEQCGVRALTQRLGRLNRFGKFDVARVVYVHTPSSKSKGASDQDKKNWPVYGNEPEKLLKLFQTHLCHSSEKINLSPGRVTEILGAPVEDSSRAPELLPEILREWTKTTFPPEGEAPVEPYFSGIKGIQFHVSIIWRASIPCEGYQLWPRATDREAIDIPISEFKGVLQPLMSKKEIKTLTRLESDGLSVSHISLEDLRPGDQVVLPTDYGLMDEFGWNPEASDPVLDMSLADHGLPLDKEAIQRISGTSSLNPLEKIVTNSDEGEELDPEEKTQAIQELFSQLKEVTLPNRYSKEDWIEFINSLNTEVITPENEVPRLTIKNPKFELSRDIFDEMSISDSATKLAPHCNAVANLAKSVSESIGLPNHLIKVLEYAGKFHDVGKADERFQRWLDPGWDQADFLAKSDVPRHKWEARRHASGWPKGGRHESLSARLIDAWLTNNPEWGNAIERELLLHLIISHHGKGRPIIKPVIDNTSMTLERMISGEMVCASTDLGTVDWNQPTRFHQLNEYFGPWGLALLEAILRLSDHAVSSGVTVSRN